MIPTGIFFGLLIVFVLYSWHRSRVKSAQKKQELKKQATFNPGFLVSHVSFYRGLTPPSQTVFREEMTEFLSKVEIVGVDTDVEELDRVLIAASATIVLFGFREWFYPNLRQVYLYSNSFNHNFETHGVAKDRDILGMIGQTSVTRDKVLLSKKSLREGFSNSSDKQNTAVHEFAHLVDMADGAVDGLPEMLIDKAVFHPWLAHIRQCIVDIESGSSDIKSYGATSEGEFFAVASEYFFERPQLMEKKHPELFALMEKAFRRKPVEAPQQSVREIGRNDTCPCGSGKKYKLCHGTKA